MYVCVLVPALGWTPVLGAELGVILELHLTYVLQNKTSGLLEKPCRLAPPSPTPPRQPSPVPPALWAGTSTDAALV